GHARAARRVLADDRALGLVGALLGHRVGGQAGVLERELRLGLRDADDVGDLDLALGDQQQTGDDRAGHPQADEQGDPPAAGGGAGASLTCLSAIVSALSPSNGTRPVSISYRMIPTE